MHIAMTYELAEKLYKVMNVMNEEMKTARDYGIGFKIHHSEVHLLEAIYKHEDANASELSNILGVTNGAVCQVAGKLMNKALIESYRMPGNKKEVYFRLTDLGKKAVEGHKEHHEAINSSFFDYVKKQIEEGNIQVVMEFMDTIISAFGGANLHEA